MGSCVSVHKDPESAMKLRMSFGSKTEKLVIPSPIKEKPIVVNGGDRTVADDGLKSRTGTTFRDLGSREEAFFDSQPWLESDCEDDFFSVNGDFTPSRGSTPVHHKFSAGSPRINRALFGEKPASPMLEPSSGEKKKRLSDLFKESLRGDYDTDDQNAAGNQNVEPVKLEAKETTLELPPKSANGTPYVSGANSVCSSERTPIGGFKSEEKPIKPVQCCLPRFRSSRSFNERKKKMSPVPSIG